MLGAELDHKATLTCKRAGKQVLYLGFQPLQRETAVEKGTTDPQPLAPVGQWETRGWAVTILLSFS